MKRNGCRVVTICDHQGESILNPEHTVIEMLYQDTGRPQRIDVNSELEQAPEMTLEELEFAIKTVRKRIRTDQISI